MKKVVYTGDMGPNQDWEVLNEIAFGADLLLIEAEAEDDTSHSHISARQAIQFAHVCGAKSTLLFHIPNERVNDVEATINRMNCGNTVQLAYDGLEIEL